MVEHSFGDLKYRKIYNLTMLTKYTLIDLAIGRLTICSNVVKNRIYMFLTNGGYLALSLKSIFG